jgi:hypothetical protein
VAEALEWDAQHRFIIVSKRGGDGFRLCPLVERSKLLLVEVDGVAPTELSQLLKAELLAFPFAECLREGVDIPSVSLAEAQLVQQQVPIELNFLDEQFGYFFGGPLFNLVYLRHRSDLHLQLIESAQGDVPKGDVLGQRHFLEILVV